MAGILDFYGYDSGANDIVSQKQQLLDNQAKIDGIQDEKIKELEEGGGSGSTKPTLIETTYSELKSLRDNSQLIPGCWYRITDYTATVNELVITNARSAGHKFDILVLATSVNTLSEEAKAIQPENDYEGVYVDDGGHCVYTGRKVTVHFTDVTKELYLWQAEGYSPYAGYYSELSLEELKSLTQEQLRNTSWFWVTDCTVISENEIGIGDTYYDNIIGFDSLGLNSYSFDSYFSKSNLNAWELKYTPDNVQWSKQAGTYVYDEDNNYTFLVLGDITLQGHNYKLLQGFSMYIEDWSNYALMETVEEGEPIYCYYGDPEDFDPKEPEEVGTASSVTFVSEEGKGTITWMKDEFGNECPYDFKNIQFKRYMATDSVSGRDGLGGKYMVADHDNCAKNLSVDDPDDFIWAYTFSSDNSGGEQTDYSLTSEYNIHDNIMKSYDGELPNNVMFGESNYSNSFGFNCYNNSWGEGCYSNSWGNYCKYNSFGNYCQNNSWGDSCYRNSCGDSCFRNSCGNTNQHNSWGNGCYGNSWGNYCQNNSCGNDCTDNSWGNYNIYNSWGNNVTQSRLFDGVQYTQIVTSNVKNVQVLNGVAGTSSNKLTLAFAANKSYTQVAALNSSGQLKIYVPGDLVQEM